MRKKLADEDKPVKYARYAFGEIVLVVIGILIALQINNWNQAQKELNVEIHLYSEIYDDLKTEHGRIEGLLREVNKYQDLHFHIYKESTGKARYDSLQYYNYLHWLQRYQMFFNEKYSSLRTTISNDRVQSKLDSYMNQERITDGVVSEWNDYKLQVVRPFLVEHGINNSEAFFSVQNPDFTTLTRMDFIDHSQLKKMYGSTELDQLFFELRFKTSWLYQNLIWLKETNLEFEEILKQELILHNNTDIVTLHEREKKYIKLLDEAEDLYDAKDYLESANKYKEAFEVRDPGPMSRYDAACSFALAGDIESAFSQLFIFVNGTSRYSHDDWPLRDSDLDILHTDIRWDKFTSILKSNIEKQNKQSE